MQLRCRIIASDSVTHHCAPELPYVQTWLPVINPRGMADWADADVAISSTVVPIKSSFFTFILLQKYTQHLLSGTPAFHDHAQVGVRSHAGATSNQSPCFCKGMSGVPLTSGHLEKLLSPSRHESDSMTVRGH